MLNFQDGADAELICFNPSIGLSYCGPIKISVISDDGTALISPFKNEGK